MKCEKENRVFKIHETGYHKSAKLILADWVNGIPEYPLTVKDNFVIIPDVVCISDGVISCAYEIIHSNPLTGRKLAMYDYWAYMNGTSITVFGVSADFILAQTDKPGYISSDCYIIDPLNTEQCTF